MSINAINSISLYEFYYSINKDDKKKKSPIERELKEYGLTSTGNEKLDIVMLQKAKDIEREQEAQTSSTIPHSERPWADVMYQLNIPFNDNPKDDIDDIKEELAKLTNGMDDEELNQEINDLINYVENLYINFVGYSSSTLDSSLVINAQLDNLAIMNRSSLF